MTFISDIDAAALIQGVGIKSTVYTDDHGSTESTLNDGSTLFHYSDPSKLTGWEHNEVASAPDVEPEKTVTDDAPAE